MAANFGGRSAPRALPDEDILQALGDGNESDIEFFYDSDDEEQFFNPCVFENLDDLDFLEDNTDNQRQDQAEDIPLPEPPAPQPSSSVQRPSRSGSRPCRWTVITFEDKEHIYPVRPIKLLACLFLAGANANPTPGGYGLGYAAPIISAPIIAPAAVSTANLYKAAPIPVVKTVIAPAPIITAPVTVPVIKTVGVSSWGLGSGLGSYGWGGYGLGGYGLGWGGNGYGWGGWGKH